MAARIHDVIDTFGQQYGADIVCLHRQIPGNPGQRITHLAVEQVVSHAWVNLTGEPFRPHHATTLMAMRRGEPAAIVAAHPRRLLSMICLTVNQLIDVPGSRAMLLVHDDIAAQVVYHEVNTFVDNVLDHDITVAVISDSSGDMPQARLLIVTYEALHRRLLRYHDRTWRPCWEAVRLIGLVDLHMAAGIGMYHIAALLVRLQRVVNRYASMQVVQWLATSMPADGLDAVLRSLGVGTWRMIPADDYPSDAVDVSVWHLPEDYLAIAHDLAVQISDAGYTAHLYARDVEQHLLPETDPQQSITVGTQLTGAQVLIVAGVADDRWLLAQALRSGYHAVVVLLGSHPLDSWYSQVPTRLVENLTVDWPLAALNAYVLTQHLRAAAYEWPLRDEEITAWHASELRERLVERQQLQALPNNQGWVSAGEDDPYDDFHLLSAIGLPVLLQIGEISLDAPFDPTGFERWLAKGASVPPWYGGMRVIQRNEDDGSVVLQPDVAQRRTLPLRSCEVAIRDTKTTHTLSQGAVVTYGRVLVTERIVGMRELRDDTVRDHLFATPLESRWSAPGWWLDVPQCVDDAALRIGWSVVLTLPVLSMLKTSAVVPCGDTTFRRLYIIDAQPGGNGAAEWMFAHIEEVLVTAVAIAQTLQADPLLAESCQLDNEWLRRLIGARGIATPAPSPTLPPIAMPAPRRDEPSTAAIPIPPVRDDDEMYTVIPSATPGAPSDVTAPQKYPPMGGNRNTPVPPRRSWATRPKRTAPEPTPPAPAPAPTTPAPSRPNPASTPSSVRPSTPATSRPNTSSTPSSVRPSTPVSSRPNTPPAPSSVRPSTSVPSRPNTPPAPSSVRPSTPATPPPSASRPPSRANPPAEATPAAPNVSRIMANIRKQIQQQLPTARNAPAATTPVQSRFGDVPRFVAGQRIFCLPYGDGDVIDSEFVDGHEYIRAEFPTYGELRIDPSVSLVRIIAEQDDQDE